MGNTHNARTERAIILQLLRDDRPALWSRAELEREVSDIEPQGLLGALASLFAEGVVILNPEQVQASRCARHLRALGLVGV